MMNDQVWLSLKYEDDTPFNKKSKGDKKMEMSYVSNEYEEFVKLAHSEALRLTYETLEYGAYKEDVVEKTDTTTNKIFLTIFKDILRHNSGFKP